MKKEDDRILSEFCSEDFVRRSHVIYMNDRLIVRCYEYEELVKNVDCTNHSLRYAEDAAENFVLGVMK